MGVHRWKMYIEAIDSGRLHQDAVVIAVNSELPEASAPCTDAVPVDTENSLLGTEGPRHDPFDYKGFEASNAAVAAAHCTAASKAISLGLPVEDTLGTCGTCNEAEGVFQCRCCMGHPVCKKCTDKQPIAMKSIRHCGACGHDVHRDCGQCSEPTNMRSFRSKWCIADDVPLIEGDTAKHNRRTAFLFGNPDVAPPAKKAGSKLGSLPRAKPPRAKPSVRSTSAASRGLQKATTPKQHLQC